MNRMTRYTACSTFSLLLMINVGCVADQADAPVFVMFNQAPTSGCTVTPSETNAGLVRGHIDAQSQYGYILTPLVKNIAETTDYIDSVQRYAFVEGVDVSLALDDGLFNAQEQTALEDLTKFSDRFSAVVYPDGGLSAFSLEIVPAELLYAMSLKLTEKNQTYSLIKATVSVFGTLGGGHFESTKFSYWVDVCNGCVINDVGPCDSIPQGTAISSGGYCSPAQDTARVDCCSDGTGLVCPASSPAAGY
jgi:hypothetical protein